MGGVKLPPPLHRWVMTPRQAIRLQERLAGAVLTDPLAGEVRLVAGTDMAFTPDGQSCVAGVVVWDVAGNTVVEQATARRPVRFPYVPGLLSFREIPAVLAAVRKLKCRPDVFMFDGQGRAHPRRIGLASHAGLAMNMPTIGCAKSRLCGEHDEPPLRAGSYVPLTHKGEAVGTVLRTRDAIKPLYISVGHRVSLEDCIRLVMACTTKYRLPEPTRLAHQLVTRERGR